MKISPNFTVEDIHIIRYDNYEKTKHLTSPELIEKTKQDAQEGWALLETLRNEKKATSN